MISIETVLEKSDILVVEKLASIIWSEHYTAIIGKDQVDYMVREFQSEIAIQNQIQRGAFYFLIYVDDVAVGYCSIQKKEYSMFLSKLYVLKTFRGKGIGSSVVDFIIDKAKKSDCTSVRLTVNKHNYNSIKAYQKMGFKIVDEVKTDIGNNFYMDDFVMEKQVIA